MLTLSWLPCWIVIVAATHVLASAAQQHPKRVCLDLIDRSSLSVHSLKTLKHEAARIWTTSTYSVVWHQDSVQCPLLVAPLRVVIMSTPHLPLPASVLATIQFENRQPLNEIHAYAGRAHALIERESRRRGPPFFVAGRDALIGRVLGRSIAHEVGHYLLRSPHHANRGLMKEWHSAHDLMRRSQTPFVLDAASAEALLARAQ